MFKFAPAFLAALLLPAAKANSIVDIAVGSPDHTMLVQAVTDLGMAEALSSEGPMTLFAPTDAVSCEKAHEID